MLHCIGFSCRPAKVYSLDSAVLNVTISIASIMQGIAEGTPAQGTPLICDVRDVARAHVLAAETPSASGRYIVSHRAPLTATALSKALQVKTCVFPCILSCHPTMIMPGNHLDGASCLHVRLLCNACAWYFTQCLTQASRHEPW